MPIKLRAMIAATAAAGLATLVLAAVLGGQEGVGPVVELAAFTIVLALSWAFPMFVLRREETEAFQLDEAFLVAMILVLPPLGVVVAFAGASLATQLIRRRPLPRVAFNTGMVVTGAGLAVGLVELAGVSGDVGAADLAITVAGAAVFLLVNATFVSAVLAIVEGQSFRAALLDGFGFRLLIWAASVAVGVLAGLAGLAYPWALGVAVLPMAVIQAVLAGSLRARGDRQRLDGLLRTAMQAHASMEPNDVEDAITESARELLRCRDARITEMPPADGELGSRLSERRYPERWLVVSERRGLDSFGAQDAKLLDAIVTVGASALENASLVHQIKHQVFHDSLTGLPNQLLFEERVSLALAQRRQTAGKLAVLFIDLDRFKRVNDSLGHPAGNELLKQVATRLCAAIRADDTVARMGGDEFTLLLTAVRSPSEAAVVAEKLLARFREPFVVEGKELFVSPSIGIAVAPEDGLRPSTLLKNADTAMYRAKERGRNCYEVYSLDMNASAHDRLALEGDLHNALD
ncbi:MAG TPA: GGDEF domain-containing protein, partial [Acidimicrobiia bacterium]|nr:GGDEF domain-containing protein [Acidimicrobiia bacterium]